jgi:uncharacterized spore protein YtfJ
MPNVDEILSEAREALTVQRVFGEPYEQDGVTVIPAAVVRGGGGGGGDDENNGGAGFGLMARPSGAYVIRDGEVRWEPAVDPDRVLLGWQLLAALSLLVAWAFARALRRG